MVDRRQFLRLGWALGTGLTVPAVMSGCGPSPGAPLPGETFVEPPMASSRDGVLDLTLAVAYLDTILDGKAVRLRSMANSIPAPTICLDAGDVLRVTVINRLPPNPPSSEPAQHFRYPNNTNLHAHGLHVTPGLVAPGVYGDFVTDDPAAGIEPGQSRLHEYRIGTDHPPGVCWYHPHLHGSSAIQLASGMAGALIIRGETDRVPEIAAAYERVFMFQAPVTDTSGRLESFAQVANDLTSEPRFLINGVRRPRLTMRRGEVQKWRFVNAGIFNFLNLRLDEHALHLYEQDGCPRADLMTISPDSQSGIVLAPGNRASVLVQAGAPGTYFLRTLRLQVGGAVDILAEDILAEVVVVDDAQPMSLPVGKLPVPACLAPITDAEFAAAGGLQRYVVMRSLFYTGTSATGATPNALVNPGDEVDDWLYQTGDTTAANTVFALGVAGSAATSAPGMPAEFIPYQSSRAIKQTVALGSVEEWTVFNMNSVRHPFHIHINPIQVTKVNGGSVAPYWADTVALPPNGTPRNPTSVTFRTRFRDFTGRFVMHCHMLAHEDMGMMQTVEVI